MARFDDLLRSLPNMVDLLAEAGVSPDYLRTDRAFTSRWAFDDGVTPVATVWRDELSDLDGIPFVTYQDPSQRPDVKGTRKKNAEDRFRMLVVRSGSPIRVVLQTKKDERSGWEAGVSRRRAALRRSTARPRAVDARGAARAGSRSALRGPARSTVHSR